MKIINVVLGRFQLVHEGHLALIAKACENYSEVYILVGSADKSRDVCNPFTFEERKHELDIKILCKCLWPTNKVKEILPVQDCDTDAEWINCIKNTIQDIKNNNKDSQINLITCKKDDKTANYIDLIKDAKIFDNVIEVEPYLENGKVISAKDKRKEFFTNTPVFKQYSWFWFSMDDYLEMQKKYICFWLSMNDYLEMQKKYIEAGLITEDDVYYANYQEEVKQYPRIEHTADIAVFQYHNYECKVLLIKRGKTPGKGLYALPGGFVNQNETLKECALRELKEETGLVIADRLHVRLFCNFDNPNRSRRGRVITTLYTTLLPKDYDINAVKAGDDASSVEWIEAWDALKMGKDAFFEDHYDMLYKAAHS
jgi:bifunctional NMN adenylyltransferase/nudix hydrolase